MFRIKVPATTANVGPGFDAIGIALEMYNTIEVEKSNHEQSFYWPDNICFVKTDNLILKALTYILIKHNKEDMGYIIHLTQCDIPMSRGLGSSAAAIVLGLFAGNYLLDFPFSTDELINFAVELEGHPDNVVPAIVGGMVVSIFKDKKIIFSSTPVPKSLVFNIMIPNFKISTSHARDVLPATYTLSECVFNISRVALLINSFHNNKVDLLRHSLNDIIHQPYRLSLISYGKEIMIHSQSCGALGEFISGAGPSLIALTDHNDKDFEIKIMMYLNSLPNEWLVLPKSVCIKGTETEVINE